MEATLSTIVPLLTPLVADPESIIRQHLAAQMLPLSITCMVEGIGPLATRVSAIVADPTKPRRYNEAGYVAVSTAVVAHLQTLIMDDDMDVRRSASESLAGLAVQIRKQDVGQTILPIPLHLATETKGRKGAPEGFPEELRISAANLLAELSGSAESGLIPQEVVRKYVMPTVLKLAADASFRVRRSAAQALPRVLGGSDLLDAKEQILPAFSKLSGDDMYRVRKSTGECLVDMSRSLMILSRKPIISEQDGEMLRQLRRNVLVPIAIKLLEDPNKFVRHGMMQFLGPFIASFYPLEEGALNTALPKGNEAVPTENTGIGSQFFPHASSMVSRLNSSAAAANSSPTPTPATFTAPEPTPTEMEELQQSLPLFLRSNRVSSLSLRSVVSHRTTHPPDPDDVAVVKKYLLDHFVELAKVNTGDDNTDAEMRVYCAYSYPAVVLLLGPENWLGDLKECFLRLVNPNFGKDAEGVGVPPLPVKRCLASSLHTVAHILGPEYALTDILPVFKEHFFRDVDDSVRLNVIRNFPWLLSLHPPTVRNPFLTMWNGIMEGEDLLGARKRSATNPMLLNWRQRDYVSRSLPDLLGLVNPVQAYKYLWPILQMLLVDTVSLVREDAEWSIPLLLRCFAPENITQDVASQLPSSPKRWSAEVCQEVISWLKETILGVPKSAKTSGNSPGSSGGTDSEYGAAEFGRRQQYCRTCATVGLAIRFGDLDPSEQWDHKFKDMLKLSTTSNALDKESNRYSPYQTLNPAERKHLWRLLVFDPLPPALKMKEDRVTNVRLTLMKILKLMPADIRETPSVSEVLQELEDEVETWESFNNGGEQRQMPQPPRPVIEQTRREPNDANQQIHQSQPQSQPQEQLQQQQQQAVDVSQKHHPIQEQQQQPSKKIKEHSGHGSKSSKKTSATPRQHDTADDHRDTELRAAI